MTGDTGREAMTTSRVLAFAAAVAVLVVAFAPAGAAPAAPAEIQDQLFKLQKDNARILDRLTELEKSLASRGTEQSPCAEAAARAQNLERQMRVMEEQLLATQRRLDETLVELRLQRRTGGAPLGVPAAPPAAPAGGDAPAPAVPEPLAAGPAGNPEDLFNGAYADYSRGHYDLALAGFEAALRADPKGPLADDAQLWTGETLFARGQYLEAAAAFDKVVAGWPQGDKTATAHLKRGFALYESKRTADGVLALQRVMSGWPGSDEARLARDFLRRKGVVAD
jgi:TolA-binding protein